MRIHQHNGVRSFKRDLRSFDIALAVKAALGQQAEMFLSDAVLATQAIVADDGESTVAAPLYSYQAVARALPFEIDGMVYSVPPAETRAYRKSLKIVVAPGRLEDHAPPQRSRRGNGALEAKLSELAQFTNVFALREEARKYMDARLETIEKRLDAIEKLQ